MNTAQLYNLFLKSSGVSTDTRSIGRDSMYFALKGANFNGNAFAGQALEKGASLAIIDEEEYEQQGTILVDDVLQSLQDLARFHREQLQIPVIGLTGSNGKTTTKELMHAVLSSRFNTLATSGNLNNHIGVPLSLLRIGKAHEIAIIEMGANHQGEIAMLSDLCQPDIGYITNFGKAHLEGFGGIEGVIKGKSELYTYLRQHHKTVLVNTDDERQFSLSQGIRSLKFGSGAEANFSFTKGIAASPTLSIRYGEVEIQSQLSGDYNFSNLAAAISLGLHFGIDIQKIKEAIEKYQPSNNRSQISRTERNLLLIDTYNANPSSMEVALQNFRQADFPAKWVILGDMFELGEYAESEHARIAKLAQEGNFEKCILIGREFSKQKVDCLQFDSTEEAMNYLKEEAPEARSILLKGSRSMKLETLIPHL